MINISICDDEVLFTKNLASKIKDLLAGYEFQDFSLKVFNNGNKLIEHKRDSGCDIAFLDIDMPHINGINLAENLMFLNKNIIIVFVTNRDDLVFDALEVHPFGFIRKSHIEDVERVLLHAIQRLNFHKTSVVIRKKGVAKRFYVDDIIYIECSKNYIIYRTKDDKIEIRGSMNTVEQEFANLGFLRVHGSYIVNVSHILEFTNDAVRLSYGIEIPISRSRFKELRSKFLQSQVFEDG